MGYVALLAATIAAGVLLVNVIATGWLERADSGANRWFAARRTPFWNDVSWVGSHLAQALTVIAVVGVVSLVLVRRRRYFGALFLVVATVVEAATYEGTVLVLNRPRPPVPRLEDLGGGASFPSGHTAAAVVVYVGIAVLVFRYTGNRLARRTTGVIAVLAPLAVALSRVYRGMHHPTDALGGALMGFGALWVGLFVVHVVSHSIERRHAEVAP
jgi:undecaprenyl-diphosphatase